MWSAFCHCNRMSEITNLQREISFCLMVWEVLLGDQEGVLHLDDWIVCQWQGSMRQRKWLTHGLEVKEEVVQVPGFLQEPNSQWPKDLSLGSASQIATGGHSQAFSIWTLGNIQHPNYSKCYRKKLNKEIKHSWQQDIKILPIMSREFSEPWKLSWQLRWQYDAPTAGKRGSSAK